MRFQNYINFFQWCGRKLVGDNSCSWIKRSGASPEWIWVFVLPITFSVCISQQTEVDDKTSC